MKAHVSKLGNKLADCFTKDAASDKVIAVAFNRFPKTTLK